ncbi:GCN5-related N-acetyltransferase family protein [Gracilaria domingensis]|nr:GCN5-related N-acetyltransferase family protein [Gracilaria domingensis]
MDQDSHPPLPIVWGDVNEKNVNQLDILHATIFPVKYNHMFYKEVLKAPKGFVKLAYHNELLVGSVCCRKEPYFASHADLEKKVSMGIQPAELRTTEEASLYIMTLGVLAPYRERRIGHRLITHVLDLVQSSPECRDVVDIYLHLQEGNDDALRFYERYGFQVTEYVRGYYRRLDPPNCYIVRKKVKS